MSQIKVDYIDHMGSDLSVVNAARVSFNKWSEKLNEGDIRLIKYLADHGHTSPFGHCFASFKVKAPIFVARHLVKSKFLRWNEVSRRYVDSEPEFFDVEEWRGKPKDKKQGSDGVVDYNCDTTYRLYAMQEYRVRLSKGVAPEQARACLPLETMTEWWWSGSLDAWASMCNLRLKPDTQEETREVAKQISKQMSEIFPYSWEALVGPSE